MPVPLTISFEGAARTVTGSRHRVTFGPHSWLFDCGLYQGHRDEADRVNRTFRFAPGELDTVVLSHAHLDHSGNLPTLVSQGFGGRIHATGATIDLCKVMLKDSAFLMERDADHVNRHRNGNQRPARRPLYQAADVEETLTRFETHEYHQPWDLFNGVRVEYFDAGHIIGSALTVFEFQSEGRRFRLGMSGDLGRPDRPILHDPEHHAGVDALVLESTYGDRLHPAEAEQSEQLAQAVTRTAARGGRVLVPSFAVGRTQELLHRLHGLGVQKRIPELPIFVDSPLASQATAVLRQHPDLLDADSRDAFATDRPFGLDRFRFVGSADESRALNDRHDPIIIISASGMCEGGRILHHLRHGLGNSANTVLFVGFQAEGTLGRRLREGAETVSIFGDPVRRRAEIVGLDGFSAHADQGELVKWAATLDPKPARIFLVHGELEPAGKLAEKLEERIGASVSIPSCGEAFDLWN